MCDAQYSECVSLLDCMELLSKVVVVVVSNSNTRSTRLPGEAVKDSHVLLQSVTFRVTTSPIGHMISRWVPQLELKLNQVPN